MAMLPGLHTPAGVVNNMGPNSPAGPGHGLGPGATSRQVQPRPIRSQQIPGQGSPVIDHNAAAARHNQQPPIQQATDMVMGANRTTGIRSWMLERELGTGGFGCVKLWKNINTGEKLALKQCRAGRQMSTKNKKRWVAECEIMLKLEHPNVVKAYEVPQELAFVNKTGELPVLAMEYCSGGDLRRMLIKPEHSCGLPEPQILAIAKDIGGAIEYLHTLNIIHRDLKPENVILRKEGDERTIYKLIDLGYAKDMDKDSICESFVGTMQYLAPELFKAEQYTRTVDYWSFGTLLFECITGFRPFLHSKTPVQWQPVIASKKDIDIHAFYDIHGRVIFSSRLPSPNWLCRTSVDTFQQLLYLLLRWDPKLRGGGQTETGRPICFHMLEKIMAVKLIRILCVPTNEVFTYPIPPDNRSLQVIMSLLERESKIPQREQELLLATGLTADPTQPAQQCLADTDDTVSMVYLFHKGVKNLGISENRRQQPCPFLVTGMMNAPRNLMGYEERRKVWGQSVHFCGEVVRDYKQLMDAQRAAMLCLLRYNTKFSKLKTQMMAAHSSLEAKVEFFNQTIDFDKQKFEDQAKTGVFSRRMHMGWGKMREEVNKLDQLKTKLWELDQQCTGLSTMIMELQRSPYTRSQHGLPLEKIEQESIELYQKLKRIPEDVRKRPGDNIDMVRCVEKCLNQRQRMTNDLYLHISKVANCRVEILRLCPSVEKMTESINLHIGKVTQYQRQRQRDIWQLLNVALTQPRQDPNSNSCVSRSPSVPSATSISSVDSSSTTASLRQNHLERLSDVATSVCEDNRQARDQLKAVIQHDQTMTHHGADQLDWTFLDAAKPDTPPATAAGAVRGHAKTKASWDLAEAGQSSEV